MFPVFGCLVFRKLLCMACLDIAFGFYNYFTFTVFEHCIGEKIISVWSPGHGTTNVVAILQQILKLFRTRARTEVIDFGSRFQVFGNVSGQSPNLASEKLKKKK